MSGIDRRTFAASGLAALAFGGLARRASAQPAAAGAGYRNEIPGYGDLVPDPDGMFDLPPGFSYRIVSTAGETMDDGFVTPSHLDGMACFPLEPGRAALVRNHELFPNRAGRGPAGGLDRLGSRLRAEPHYGKDNDGRVLPGGTTTIVYDVRRGVRERQWLSLAGTMVNCAGGATPWGSWLSCEETVWRAGQVERDHGWVFEVPAAARGLSAAVPLTAMGRFRHEAAAVDPGTGIVYLTEDEPDGLFYRFLPNRPGTLAEGGRLQALALRERAAADTRNWSAVTVPPGSSHPVRWIDLDEVASPAGDLRLRGHAAGAAVFARGEGIHAGRGEFYFTCTSGGAARIGQIFRYVPSPAEGRRQEGSRPGRLHSFVESADRRVLDYADNLTVAPWGHLIVCEDPPGPGPCHLRGVDPRGRTYVVARCNWDTELAGVCFSPDGSVLFVNVYHPGRTLAIAGPWRSVLAGAGGELG